MTQLLPLKFLEKVEGRSNMKENRALRLVRAYLRLGEKMRRDYTPQIATVLALHLAWYSANVSDVDAALDARKSELLGFVNKEGSTAVEMVEVFPA